VLVYNRHEVKQLVSFYRRHIIGNAFDIGYLPKISACEEKLRTVLELVKSEAELTSDRCLGCSIPGSRENIIEDHVSSLALLT